VVGVTSHHQKKSKRSVVADEQAEQPADKRLRVLKQSDPTFIWNEDDFAAENYARLGERLATSGDLFRSPGYGNGLTLLLPNGRTIPIDKGVGLLPVIIDRVPVRIIRDGKPKGGRIPAAHLNSMLMSESFLCNFRSVDRISTHPVLLADFSVTTPGFNDGGENHRILFSGMAVEPSSSLDTINSFLDVMAFETQADRTNAVAAALTVMARDHWPGGKPIILATATKSHAGKDTVINFAAGLAGTVSISYQAKDWAVERSFVGTAKTAPNVGVLIVENARLDGRKNKIASGFLERFATDPEPVLFSTGSGRPVRRRNDVVLAISTNFGMVSEDILNRALPIHLAPVGDVADRRSPIGNPRDEFLPANREKITSELVGMVARWKAEGMPLDDNAHHSFSLWAKTIGGILKANGFEEFLGNCRSRRTQDDPIKHSLAILGAARPDEWLRPGEWAASMVELGLAKTLIESNERDTEAGRKRALGVLLSAHKDEVFEIETDSHRLRLRLKSARRRFGSEPHVRYCFEQEQCDILPFEDPNVATENSTSCSTTSLVESNRLIECVEQPLCEATPAFLEQYGDVSSNAALASKATIMPRWNDDKRSLSVGDQLIKCLTKPAPLQTLVLRAFQELGWPARIDDPLKAGQRDYTVASLNRNHTSPGIIQFGRDGTGEGINWRLVGQ
jgi:hypothetical protein